MGALKSGAGSQRVVVPSAGGGGGGGSGRNQPFAGLLASSVPGPLSDKSDLHDSPDQVMVCCCC